MPILTSAHMRAAEQAAFARGVQVEALMDQAGAGVAQAVTKFFPKPGKCIVFAGKGHNAGDALVAAQCLRGLGWKIEIRLAFKKDDCSELTRKKLEGLSRRPPEIFGCHAIPRWRDTQHLRWSASQAFELLAREFAAIVLLEGKADFDFPPKAP